MRGIESRRPEAIRHLDPGLWGPAALVAALLAALAAALRWGHVGAIASGSHWSHWPVSPEITVPLAVLALLYVAGHREGARDRAQSWRHLAFFGGLAAVFVALQSPIEPISDHVFLVHQIEHMLLRTVGPLLILLAAPQAALLRGLPDRLRHRVVAPLLAGRWLRIFGLLRRPAVATALFVGTTYFWMVPHYHDLAILDEPIHYLWHTTLLLSGLLFFWCLLDPRPSPHGASLGARLFMAWFAMMGNILLGLFLSFKTVPLYHAYDVLGRWWAVSPLADERFGGLTMWVPGTMMLALAALWMIYSRARQEEKSAARSPVRAVTAAEWRASRRTANRAVALGLVAFAVTVLAISLGSAFADRYYDALLRSRLSATIGLRKVPIALISTSTTSPGFIHKGGLRAKPTPSGVPVAMTSPGSSGVHSEQ